MLNKFLILAVEVNRWKVKSYEIRTWKRQILDIKMAINSIIFDFQSEINSPETRDERKAAANKSIQNRWIPLLKNIEQQFKEQED